jgi:hypothetical protein
MTKTDSTIDAVMNKFGSEFKRIKRPNKGSYFNAKLRNGIEIRVIDFDDNLLIEAFQQENNQDIWSSGVYVEQLDGFNPKTEQQMCFAYKGWL